MGNVVGDEVGFSTTIGRILKKLLPEWDDDQIERTQADLYNVGIVRLSNANSPCLDTGIIQLEYRLTEFGNKIVDYLTNPVAHQQQQSIIIIPEHPSDALDLSVSEIQGRDFVHREYF